MAIDDFNSAKRKNFDIIADSRLDLSKSSKKNFNSIVENTYNFPNFNIMDKYSRSILKEDVISFFKQIFIDRENLKFTVYVK